MDTRQKMIVGGVAIAGVAGLFYASKRSSGAASSSQGQTMSITAGGGGFETAGTLYIPTTSQSTYENYGTNNVSNSSTNGYVTSTQVGTEVQGNATIGTSTTGSQAAAGSAPSATSVSAGNNSGNASNSNNSAPVNSNNPTTTATTVTNSPGTAIVNTNSGSKSVPATTQTKTAKALTVAKPAPQHNPTPKKAAPTAQQALFNRVNDGNYKGVSIVDYLKGAKVDSSYKARQGYAATLGIKNYHGTAAQNTQMLKDFRANRTGA